MTPGGSGEGEQRHTCRAAITWQVRFFKVKGVKDWCTAQATKLGSMLFHMTMGFDGKHPWFADLMVLLSKCLRVWIYGNRGFAPDSLDCPQLGEL